MKTKFTLFLAIGLLFALATKAQDRDDYRDNRNRHYDIDRHSDLYDIRHDRAEMYRDQRYGYWRGARLERMDLRFDRRQYRHERNERFENRDWR